MVYRVEVLPTVWEDLFIRQNAKADISIAYYNYEAVVKRWQGEGSSCYFSAPKREGEGYHLGNCYHDQKNRKDDRRDHCPFLGKEEMKNERNRACPCPDRLRDQDYHDSCRRMIRHTLQRQYCVESKKQ